MPKFTSVAHNSGENNNVAVAVVYGPKATAEMADLIATGVAIGVADDVDVEDIDFDDITIHPIATFAGGPTAVLSTGDGPDWAGVAVEVKAGSRQAKALIALGEAYAAAQDDDEDADDEGTDNDLGAGAEPVCRLSEGDN